MAFDYDETNPTDDYLIPSYPANERSHRVAVKSSVGVEHDTDTGRHKIGVGDDTARDAITNWVVGSLWLNDTSGNAYLERVTSIGPVVWQTVDARPGICHYDEINNFTFAQYATHALATVSGGNLPISMVASPAKYASIPASTAVTIQNPSTPVPGASTTVTLELTNAGTGSSLIWDTLYVFPNGNIPPFDTSSGAINFYSMTRLSLGSWLVTSAPGVA